LMEDQDMSALRRNRVEMMSCSCLSLSALRVVVAMMMRMVLKEPPGPTCLLACLLAYRFHPAPTCQTPQGKGANEPKKDHCTFKSRIRRIILYAFSTCFILASPIKDPYA
jgi:hypothetical protein